MTHGLWRFLFGGAASPPSSRADRRQRLEGLMREREQLDQSSERWRERMTAEIRKYAELSEEAVSVVREECDAEGHPE